MRALSIVTVAFALLVCGAARADTADADVAEAKRLYRAATTLYNLGEYEQALAQFKSAYKLKSDPAFLFNIAQCQRQLADYVAAEKSYRAFLRETPDAPEKVRTEVQRLVDEMAKAAREARANQPPVGTREPAADDKSEAKTAPPPTIVTPPPAATTAPAAADLTARAPERQPVTKKAWFWATLGGAVVVAAGAVTLGVVLGTRPQAIERVGQIEGN